MSTPLIVFRVLFDAVTHSRCYNLALDELGQVLSSMLSIPSRTGQSDRYVLGCNITISDLSLAWQRTAWKARCRLPYTTCFSKSDHLRLRPWTLQRPYSPHLDIPQAMKHPLCSPNPVMCQLPHCGTVNTAGHREEKSQPRSNTLLLPKKYP
jgi:hypothetical protein